MNKTTFRIQAMDCPSEERLIRMKLEGDPAVHQLEFDIPERKLVVFHNRGYTSILEKLHTLKLNSSFQETVTDIEVVITPSSNNERSILWKVLLINFSLFILEMLYGILSDSMALIADSLDMLADSLVYGMALLAVGGTLALKKNIAKASGFLQLLLAIIGFVEVIRRFTRAEEMPVFQNMIIISVIALTGNAVCLYLLQKSRSAEVHMRASMIFTSNDVIVNVGVILAGVLVYYFHSSLPDLIVGSLVFVLVIRGAFRILQLAK